MPGQSILAALAAVALVGGPAAAATILQNEADSTNQIEFHMPIGQSFTAIGGRLVAFAFSFGDMNDPFPNEQLTVAIIAGTDLAAVPLASASLLLEPGLLGFVDFAFDLSVASGSVYTALVSATNPRWGIDGTEFDVYAGGTQFLHGEPSGDARFRATFADAAPVPLPATVPLLGAALALLALVRRRRG